MTVNLYFTQSDYFLHTCHTCSLCRVELVVQFPARGSTQVLLCLFPGVLWLWHFLYSVGPHPVSSLHIYTFVVSRAFMAGAASQAGDADSSRAPGLTSGLQGSVNVHRGYLLLVPQWQCISSFVFYIHNRSGAGECREAPVIGDTDPTRVRLRNLHTIDPCILNTGLEMVTISRSCPYGGVYHVLVVGTLKKRRSVISITATLARVPYSCKEKANFRKVWSSTKIKAWRLYAYSRCKRWSTCYRPI